MLKIVPNKISTDFIGVYVAKNAVKGQAEKLQNNPQPPNNHSKSVLYAVAMEGDIFCPNESECHCLEQEGWLRIKKISRSSFKSADGVVSPE